MGLSGGLIFAGTLAAGAVSMTLATIPFLLPGLRRVCLPYVPATPSQLQHVAAAISHLQQQQTNRTSIPSVAPQIAPIVDLGSGDGRVVLQCAAAGYQSVGIELNSLLVLYSKYKARRLNVAHLAKFYRRNIFRADLSGYRTAIIFGAELLMDDLVPKLDDMLLGSHLIACRFPLPPKTKWKLVYKVGDGIDAVWLYQKCDHIVEENPEEDLLALAR